MANKYDWEKELEQNLANEDKPGEDTPTSLMESFFRGGAQGATFGFADEITGAGEAAYEKMFGHTPTPEQAKTFGELYRQKRDESRAAYKKAEEDNYWTSMLGNLAGGVVAPGVAVGATAAKAGLGAAMAQGAKMGAAAGGVSGLGTSQADLTQGEVGQAAIDAGKGSFYGGIGGGLLPIAAKGGEFLLGKGKALYDKSKTGLVSELTDNKFGKDALDVSEAAVADDTPFGISAHKKSEGDVTALAAKLQDMPQKEAAKWGNVIKQRIAEATERKETFDTHAAIKEAHDLIDKIPGYTQEAKDKAKQILIDTIENKPLVSLVDADRLLDKPIYDEVTGERIGSAMKARETTRKGPADQVGNPEDLVLPKVETLPEGFPQSSPAQEGPDLAGSIDPKDIIRTIKNRQTVRAMVDEKGNPTGDFFPEDRQTIINKVVTTTPQPKPAPTLEETNTMLRAVKKAAYKSESPENLLVRQAMHTPEKDFRRAVGGLEKANEKLSLLHDVKKITGRISSDEEQNPAIATLIKKMASDESEDVIAVDNFFKPLREYNPKYAKQLEEEMRKVAERAALVSRISKSEPMGVGATLGGIAIGGTIGAVPGAIIGGIAGHMLGSSRTNLLRGAYAATRVGVGAQKVAAKAGDIATYFGKKTPEFIKEAASRVMLLSPFTPESKTRLAKILTEASSRSTVGRNALIFTIMQNPEYKDMIHAAYPDIKEKLEGDKIAEEAAKE